MSSDDKPDAAEITKKYEELTEAMRETVQDITDKLKPLTDEIEAEAPDPLP